MMVQAIADKLAGLEPHLPSKGFTEPWLTAWKAVNSANGQGPHAALLEAIEELEEKDEIMGAVLTAKPGSRRRFKPLLDIAKTLKPVTWLWEPWIVRGYINLWGADPGVGKSIIALDMCRRIIHDLGFPDDTAIPDPGANVLYVDAEGIPNLMDERARAWGMDRSKLFVMYPELGLLDLLEPSYQDELIERVALLDPALVVVDSLNSISVKGNKNVEDVRELLSFLAILARDYDIPLVLIHHLRKPGRDQRARILTQADLSGSGHITAMGRVVWGISLVQTGPELDRNGPRRVEILKSNFTYPKPIGVEFQGLPNGSVLLDWTEHAPEAYEEPTEVDRCGEWLVGLLGEAGESMKPKEVIALAQLEGYNRRMVYRAKRKLSDLVIDTEENKRNPMNAWVLASDKPEAANCDTVTL
jgi:hypothetical protein